MPGVSPSREKFFAQATKGSASRRQRNSADASFEASCNVSMRSRVRVGAPVTVVSGAAPVALGGGAGGENLSQAGSAKTSASTSPAIARRLFTEPRRSIGERSIGERSIGGE